MIEVEIRAKVPSLIIIEKMISQQGAKFSKEIFQRDRIFGHEMFLDKNNFIIDGGLSARLRNVDNKIQLDFKEIKRQTGGREWTINLFNEEHGITLLKKLGFKEAFIIEKQRKEYLLDGFTICLDNVKDLGEFLEIEKEIMNPDEKNSTREKCLEILNKIAPDAIVENKKYGDLIQEIINSKK